MRLPEFRLESYFSRWEFTAPHHMTASDAESMSLRDLLAYATDDERAEFESLHLGYTPTFGTSELRAAIASTYERIAPHHELCFAGAQEGLWCAMHALLEPGDHAIVTVPNYQSLETLPSAICGDAVTGIALRPERSWQIDLDELARAMRPTTRLVAINVPNNATGAVPTRADFQRLVALCAERGIALLSDEVYRGIERGLAAWRAFLA